ncbi:MAG: hypothetical protein HFI40_05710 [Lachnospiraceae bacterium]|jgi:hypothetical protein|nr:hypothetical protein [Lachnospiraceae bacterium]MCX4317579.1 hypothetical protein [Lachnospiraceae bacterium]
MKTKTIITKLAAGMAAVSLLCSLGSISASARGRNYVDANQDGVCDYCTTDCSFVDEDGDGICDHFAAQSCPGQGHHRRAGRGQGRGGCHRR